MNRQRFSRRDVLAGIAAAGMVHAGGSDTIRLGMIGCGGRNTEAAGQAMTADRGVRLVAMADLLMERVHTKRQLL